MVRTLACSIAIVAVGWSNGARAESAAPSCVIDDLIPSTATLPANFPGWSVQSTRTPTATLTYESESGPTSALVEIGVRRLLPGYAVRPSELVAGRRYTLELALTDCSITPETLTHSFNVTPAIPLPESLGEIRVSELYAGNRIQGLRQRQYFVIVEIDASEDALPWEGLLNTFVYDQYDVRVGEGGPLEAHHEVRVRVDRCRDGGSFEIFLHGGAEAFSSEVIATTETVRKTIDCADAMRVDLDTLEPLTPEQIAYWDMPPPMDGGLPPDVDSGPPGMRTDAGRDASPVMEEPPSDGCSCRTTHRSSPAWTSLLLGVGLASLVVGRRRRSTPPRAR